MKKLYVFSIVALFSLIFIQKVSASCIDDPGEDYVHRLYQRHISQGGAAARAGDDHARGVTTHHETFRSEDGHVERQHGIDSYPDRTEEVKYEHIPTLRTTHTIYKQRRSRQDGTEQEQSLSVLDTPDEIFISQDGDPEKARSVRGKELRRLRAAR